MSGAGAILLAVGATVLINLGFVLQKQGVKAAEARAREEGGRRSLFRFRVWRVGLVMMLTGWGLYLAALQRAPISIVQPALGAGFIVLALFCVFYLKEKIRALEWVAFAAMAVGIILLGFSAAGEEKVSGGSGLRLAGVTLALALLSLIGFLLSRSAHGWRVFRPEILLGLVVGLLIGLGSLHFKAMFNYLAAAEDVASTGLSLPPGGNILSPRLIALAICLPLGVGGNILGLVVLQRAFVASRALVVVPLQQVTNKVVVIIAGMGTLGEALPDDSLRAAMRLAAFFLVLLSTAVLARFGGEELAEKLPAP